MKFSQAGPFRSPKKPDISNWFIYFNDTSEVWTHAVSWANTHTLCIWNWTLLAVMTGNERRARADATVGVWLAKKCLAWTKAILSRCAVARRDAFIASLSPKAAGEPGSRFNTRQLLNWSLQYNVSYVMCVRLCTCVCMCIVLALLVWAKILKIFTEIDWECELKKFSLF